MSPTACILAARSNAVSRAQASAASPAAAIAARASSRSPSGTEPIVSPVAGLDADDVSPVALGRHAPPMNMSSSVTEAIGRSRSAARAQRYGPNGPIDTFRQLIYNSLHSDWVNGSELCRNAPMAGRRVVFERTAQPRGGEDD